MVIIITVLAFFGAALVLMCCAGILIMPNTCAKLHYVGPASSLGTFCIAAAIVLQEMTQDAVPTEMLTAAFVGLVIAIGGPLLTHATARAAYIRETGRSPEDEPSSEAAS